MQLAVLLALLGCLVQDGSGGGSSSGPPAWQVAAEQQPPADLNLTQLRWVLEVLQSLVPLLLPHLS